MLFLSLASEDSALLIPTLLAPTSCHWEVLVGAAETVGGLPWTECFKFTMLVGGARAERDTGDDGVGEGQRESMCLIEETVSNGEDAGEGRGHECS